MVNRRVVLLFFVLIVINLELFECKRSGGSRKSSSRVTTRAPNRRTTSSHRQTTPYRSAQKVTTPRYNIQTSAAHPNYNQPKYNQPTYSQPNYNQPNYNQPHYNQPGYNRPNYNQPNYNQPGYNRPNYNQPNYNQPNYNQGFPGNNYYSSGVWQRKKDHSVRNSVLAGLGGSALGLYLGYKLGGLTSGYSGGNYNGGFGGPSGYPQYSVVHHYHHGDRPIIQDGKVEADVIKACDNITFCTTNTIPLCMTNGTVYCIAPIDSTIICHENSTDLKCVNSTITLPCENATNCDSTSLNKTFISIPCVTTIDVFAEFGTNKFTVNKVSKRSAENETSATTEDSTTPVVTNLTSPIMLSDSPSNNSPSTNLNSRGIGNKYCVTVIAEPYKEPEVPPNLTNEEFARFVSDNPDMKNVVDEKLSEVSNSILGYLLL